MILSFPEKLQTSLVDFQHGNIIASYWPRIESELDHEIEVKDREVEWLKKIASEIQPRLTEDQQQGKIKFSLLNRNQNIVSLLNDHNVILQQIAFHYRKITVSELTRRS
jgi:hypothetical protein